MAGSPGWDIFITKQVAESFTFFYFIQRLVFADPESHAVGLPCRPSLHHGYRTPLKSHPAQYPLRLRDQGH